MVCRAVEPYNMACKINCQMIVVYRLIAVEKKASQDHWHV
jgi:hypothetical protein